MKTTAKLLLAVTLFLVSTVTYSQTLPTTDDFSRFKNDVVNGEFLYKMLTQDSATAVKNYDYYASYVNDTATFKISLGRNFQFYHCGFRKFYFDVIVNTKKDKVEYYDRYIGGASQPVYIFNFYTNEGYASGEYFNGVSFSIKNDQFSNIAWMDEFIKKP